MSTSVWLRPAGKPEGSTQWQNCCPFMQRSTENKMRAFLLACVVAVCGCAPAEPFSSDLARIRAAVTFRVERDAPDMTGFVKHWDLGARSAWYNASAGEVLLIGQPEGGAMRIVGFPKEYGRIVATGWENGERFFVHVSSGADTGTMIHCDLEKKQIVDARTWGAW